MLRFARLAFAVVTLLAVGVWPAVHHVLMDRWEGDAWKLFGWSMYAAADPQRSLALHAIRDQRVVPLREVPPAVADEARRFLARYDALGRRADPSELAATIGREIPGLEGVMIEVRTSVLDAASDRVELREPQREVFLFE